MTEDGDAAEALERLDRAVARASSASCPVASTRKTRALGARARLDAGACVVEGEARDLDALAHLGAARGGLAEQHLVEARPLDLVGVARRPVERLVERERHLLARRSSMNSAPSLRM